MFSNGAGTKSIQIADFAGALGFMLSIEASLPIAMVSTLMVGIAPLVFASRRM
jgi:hypothetical protein